MRDRGAGFLWGLALGCVAGLVYGIVMKQQGYAAGWRDCEGSALCADIVWVAD